MLQGFWALPNSAEVSEKAAFIPSGTDKNTIRSLFHNEAVPK